MATRMGSSQHQGSDRTITILLILDLKDLNFDLLNLKLAGSAAGVTSARSLSWCRLSPVLVVILVPPGRPSAQLA